MLCRTGNAKFSNTWRSSRQPARVISHACTKHPTSTNKMNRTPTPMLFYPSLIRSMLGLIGGSQYIHMYHLVLFIWGKSSNAGSWPQVSGHNSREVHCCVKPHLVRTYISFPKQGPCRAGTRAHSIQQQLKY